MSVDKKARGNAFVRYILDILILMRLQLTPQKGLNCGPGVSSGTRHIYDNQRSLSAGVIDTTALPRVSIYSSPQ